MVCDFSNEYRMQVGPIPYMLALILDLLSFVRFCRPRLRLPLGTIHFWFEDAPCRPNSAWQRVLNHMRRPVRICSGTQCYSFGLVQWPDCYAQCHYCLLCFYRIARVYPGVIFTFQPVHVSESSVHKLLRSLP